MQRSAATPPPQRGHTRRGRIRAGSPSWMYGGCSSCVRLLHRDIYVLLRQASTESPTSMVHSMRRQRVWLATEPDGCDGVRSAAQRKARIGHGARHDGVAGSEDAPRQMAIAVAECALPALAIRWHRFIDWRPVGALPALELLLRPPEGRAQRSLVARWLAASLLPSRPPEIRSVRPPSLYSSRAHASRGARPAARRVPPATPSG